MWCQGEFLKRALKTNNSSLSVWRAILSIEKTYGRDDVKRILVSIAFWNQVMFLHFTSMSNSLSIIKASVNNQSNEGLWQRARWKKRTEFGSGTYFLHTWGAGAGACGGGWERMFQRRKVLPLQVFSRHHRSSRRTRDRLKHVWTKIIYRDLQKPGEFAQHPSKQNTQVNKIRVGVFLLGKTSFLFFCPT